jgi:hypothetical protein
MIKKSPLSEDVSPGGLKFMASPDCEVSAR